MKAEKINKPANKMRVLVAPLNWGLGHATRCIPIISECIKQDCTVIVAATGKIKILLQQEFPDVEFLDLPGYNITYSKKKWWMPVKMLLQFPGLLISIYSERKWLHKIIISNQINAVISDNRMGLSNRKIPCIYLTHQLQIKTGNSFTSSIARRIHYHYINKFNACWVPDASGKPNLAGELSHPAKMPGTPVNYLGSFSRFVKYDEEIKYDCCIILSGPEPQRSIFENILFRQLPHIIGTCILVRGLPRETDIPGIEIPGVKIINYLTAAELNTVILQSECIISRSGYTTIMDLVNLNKKAVLVPTPGQTEQEYLAWYMQEQQFFITMPQNGFSLNTALEKAVDFRFNNEHVCKNRVNEVVSAFLTGARSVR